MLDVTEAVTSDVISAVRAPTSIDGAAGVVGAVVTGVVEPAPGSVVTVVVPVSPPAGAVVTGGVVTGGMVEPVPPDVVVVPVPGFVVKGGGRHGRRRRGSADARARAGRGGGRAAGSGIGRHRERGDRGRGLGELDDDRMVGDADRHRGHVRVGGDRGRSRERVEHRDIVLTLQRDGGRRRRRRGPGAGLGPRYDVRGPVRFQDLHAVRRRRAARERVADRRRCEGRGVRAVVLQQGGEVVDALGGERRVVLVVEQAEVAIAMGVPGAYALSSS